MKRRRPRGQRFEGLADFLVSSGHFNTADLNEIGRAVDDLFVALEVAPENLFDVEEYLPVEDASAEDIKADVEDLREAWREHGAKPVGLLPDLAEPLDLGAKLVQELADRGFRIVRER